MSRFMAECPQCGEMFDDEDAWFEHGRLQAEAERLQADHEAERAADKARIAAQQWLLEQCQQSLRENSETYVELDAYLRGDIDHSEVLAIKAEHEVALSQQGKEGET